MAKRTSSTRLLRSLLKAGAAQQKAAGKMMTGMLALARPAARKTPRTRPSTSPPTPVAPGRWLAGHHLWNGHRLAYWLYLPQEVPPVALQRGLPLVLMLHGCQQTATQFAQGTRMNLMAEKKGYAVLYPQQSTGVHAQRCWRWFDKATQQGGGDVQPVAALLAHVLAQYPVDRQRVYACGISAGAAMANIMALNDPDVFAAVGMHSGPVFGAGHHPIGALGVMRHGGGARTGPAIREVLARRDNFPLLPAILIQGAADKVVHAVNQQQLIEQSLLLNGMAADAPAKVMRRGTRHGHEIRDYLVGSKVVVRAVQIDALEHAWSGGDPAVAFHAKGGPDASRMMLEFFGKHRR